MKNELFEELSEIGDLGQGTLASLIIRKKGVRREGVLYDNSKVHVLMWTGFHYRALVGRAYNRLHVFWNSGTFLQSLLTAVRQAGHSEVTLQDVSEAVQETNEAFLKVLNGDGGIEIPSSIWKPLEVNGITVKGAKVYIGRTRKTRGPFPEGPENGMIYLDGVKLGEKILEPAPHWKPTQQAKTAAKDILKSWLPNGLYVRYCLNPNCLEELKVGKAASETAKAASIFIEPEAVRGLFKIAI